VQSEALAVCYNHVTLGTASCHQSKADLIRGHGATPGSGGSREPQVLSAQSLINGAISEKKALDEI
jgi:hypothetical protein